MFVELTIDDATVCHALGADMLRFMFYAFA